MSRHQRGYIFEAHGAYHVRYYTTVDGVRKQLSHRLCTKDRATGHGSPAAKAVRAICEEFMQTVNSDAPTPRSLSVVEFWETIYLPFITSNFKHSTIEGYKQKWGAHLKEHFGATLLRDYRTPKMSVYLTQLAKTLRPASLNHIKWLASSVFAHAVATGECDTNPIRDAMVLGKMLPNGITKSYTLEEIENVISALVDRVDFQLIMALSFFLGLRRCEIEALQWNDIDADFVHVRRGRVNGVVGTPKTLKSLRSVPLIAPVRVFLVLWRAKSRGEGWVFPNEKGEPLNLGQLGQSHIRPALDKAGVPWKGYHAGRRGLGTALKALTGNSNAGRDVLGHSTTRVTEQSYEHAMPEEALKGMRLLEAKAKA